MVDFSLTEADRRLMDLTHQENEIGRRYARDIDRTAEHRQPVLRKTHPDLEGTEYPYDLLERDSEATSGAVITQALMHLVSANDVTLREKGPLYGGLLLSDFGTPEQKATYGNLRLAVALTEPGAGSDPGNMSSSWRYDAGTNEYVLNGEKVFISAINKYDGVVTLLRGAPDDKGRRVFSSFVILKTDKGFHELKQFEKLGLHEYDIGGFIMQDLRVPASARLAADFAATMSRFNHNRPLVAAIALGFCRSLLDFTQGRLAAAGIAVDFAMGRGARSAAADKLIRLEARWEAACGTVMHTKWMQHTLGTASRDYRTEASMAKALGGKAAREITQGCLELLGPEGLSEDYLAEKWFRDARVCDIYEGAGEIQRILVARSLFGYGKNELS